MMTACLVCPWVGSGASPQDAKRPQVGDDYTLESCRDVSAQGSLLPAARPDLVAVEIRCTHEIWEAVVNDPDYAGNVLWYQEDGKGRRVMGRG